MAKGMIAHPGMAVKAILVRDGKILLIRRRDDDVHKAGCWDLPGGRLGPGEDPRLGLEREVHEETGLSIKIKNPVSVHHFTKDDGEIITLISYWCECLPGPVTLSDEHTAFEWLRPEEAASRIDETMKKDIKEYMEWFV